MALDTETTDDTQVEDTSIRAGLEAAFDAAAETAPAPAPTAAPAPAAAAPTPAPTDAPAPEVDPNAAPAPATERAIPERLKQRFGEKWATLPPDVREAYHEYESHIGRLASTYGKGAKEWQRAQATFAPYAEMVAQEGGDFHGAMSNLLETARILRQGSPEQKIVLLRQTAQAFGVPLEALVGTPAIPGGEGPREGAPPAINENLINRLNTLEREVLTTRAGAVHNTQQQVNTEIETFCADPANIYLQEPGYLETMATLINAGKAQDLPSAYKQAAWLHERPRQLEIARANQQRNEASAAAAAAAKRRSVSVPGHATGNLKVDPNKLSLRDALSAAMDGELES